jgi:hypothetical protein
MTREISEEAKLAIQNGALVRARGRLVKDGCQTDAAMRRRLLALAAERNIPPAEYAKLMHKRVLMPSIQNFCRKYDVSLDWLLDGDLKGLQRMKNWERQGQGMTADEQRAEILRLLLALPPASKKSRSNGSNSKWQWGTTPMRNPKAKKAAKTRAKNSRFRAANAKALSAAVLSEKTLIEKRAKAYADMEPHLCDVVRMGEIATSLFDCSDQGLFVFAVGHLEEMLLELRKHYYAEEFPI